MGLILLAILSIPLFLIGKHLSEKYYKYDIIGFFIMMVTLLIIVFSVSGGLVAYFDYASSVDDFKAQKQTILELKNNEMAQLERIKLAEKVINTNSWLARAKYWNQTFLLGTFIPDEVMELEPIDYKEE